MRQFGFSTGAVAFGDFRAALQILSHYDFDVVELSALRHHELPPLVAAFESLEISRYAYVSVHAPSQFPESEEANVVALLTSLSSRGIPVVLHPDAIFDWRLSSAPGRWLRLGSADISLTIGRTTAELIACFERLPEAGLCFDMGHARQVDPSLVESRRIIAEFANRIRQVHISDVGSDSTHERISWGAARSFSALASMIPENAPIVIESVTSSEQVLSEIARARASFGEMAYPGVETMMGAA